MGNKMWNLWLLMSTVLSSDHCHQWADYMRDFVWTVPRADPAQPPRGIQPTWPSLLLVFMTPLLQSPQPRLLGSLVLYATQSAYLAYGLQTTATIHARPQDDNKTLRVVNSNLAQGEIVQHSLRHEQSDYSYPQVPGSYPMQQPLTAPPSYPHANYSSSCSDILSRTPMSNPEAVDSRVAGVNNAPVGGSLSLIYSLQIRP